MLALAHHPPPQPLIDPFQPPLLAPAIHLPPNLDLPAPPPKLYPRTTPTTVLLLYTPPLPSAPSAPFAQQAQHATPDPHDAPVPTQGPPAPAVSATPPPQPFLPSHLISPVTPATPSPAPRPKAVLDPRTATPLAASLPPLRLASVPPLGLSTSLRHLSALLARLHAANAPPHFSPPPSDPSTPGCIAGITEWIADAWRSATTPEWYTDLANAVTRTLGDAAFAVAESWNYAIAALTEDDPRSQQQQQQRQSEHHHIAPLQRAPAPTFH